MDYRIGVTQRAVCWVLGTLNLLLVVIVVWQARESRALRLERRDAPEHSAETPGGLTERGSALASRDVLPQSPLRRPVVPSSASSLPPLNWRAVESSDYRTYVENLRSIGCPETTIRDIIRADLKGTYAARRSAAVEARYRDLPHWKAGPAQAEARAALARERQAIDQEMGEVLTSLLGGNVETAPSTEHEWREAELLAQLGFLAPEKGDQARRVLMQNIELDRQIRALADGHRPTQDPGELQQLLDDYAAKTDALRQVLTPEEYEQVDMRVSWTADNLRQAMARFDPSEDEFQMIFRAWRAHDEDLARRYALGEPDPGNQHVFEQIRQALGEERFQLYRDTWWR